MTQALDARRKRLAATLAISSGLLLGASAFYLGSDAASAQEPEVPAYEVVDTSGAAGVNELSVATDETREDGLRLIAEDLKDENTPDGGTLLVEYYDAEDTSESTGFALVFDDKGAVLDTGQTRQFGEVYDRADAERIMEEEGGIRVVGYQDFAAKYGWVWERIKDFLI